MRRKFIAPIVVLSLFIGVLFYAASGRDYDHYAGAMGGYEAPQSGSAGSRRMVDMIADDSYLIEKGDSTIFILVGHFAAHHNGTVILADSAVRYSNQSFECFGNVLINQNTTYAYGDRAEYNRDLSTATIYSDLVKVIDGDAVMYTYHCTFNSAEDMGRFYGGCYVEKGESLLEADHGYYNTATHDLIAVDRVEMRDEKYLMTGDSVIFNTQTEDARYFTNTNIWNDKDEYLFANAGSYTKARDLHHLTRDAYILSPEREIWSDTIEYYRTEGHIIGRRNIQMDDTTQKVLGFSDYGEWWDEPGNALFTRQPSLINYDPEQPDSLFLRADTLWIYTIPVLPPAKDTTAMAEEGGRDSLANDKERAAMGDNPIEEAMPSDEDGIAEDTAEDTAEGEAISEQELTEEGDSLASPNIPMRPDSATPERHIDDLRGSDEELHAGDVGDRDARTAGERSSKERRAGNDLPKPGDRSAKGAKGAKDAAASRSEARGGAVAAAGGEIEGMPERGEMPERNMERPENRPTQERVEAERDTAAEVATERRVEADSLAVDSLARGTIVTDSLVRDTLAVDSLAQDSLKVLTPKQIRYRAKLEKRRVRDSVRGVERAIRDSIRAIKQAEQDSIQHIRDSLYKIKIDTIIAKRREQSARIADEEAARLERVKQKALERERRKIDRAKARALRRGKEYTGKDYTLDTLATDSLAADSLADERERCDSLATDSLATDSLAVDSLAVDSMTVEKPFPADSAYKMIKAYRAVKMYRSDSQLVCDSLTMMNTDSIIRLYIDPVLWQETNQITSDSMAIYTRNELMHKAHFMGDPIMGTEIDTMYYNQVKGKDMIAYFEDGSVYRNDVNGNAQTIYYMQDEDSPEVTGLMYIESASISFYLIEGQVDKITYKQNPEYVLYPIAMVPETQQLKLPDFAWHYDRRPTRDSITTREIRATRREEASAKQKPRFRITERINYDRRRLVENNMWVDRLDELTPEIIEWRNTRTSYNKN